MAFVRALCVLSCLMLAAPPALAQEASADEGAKPERLICKKDRATGTRFQKKTCRTAKQWDELAEIARRSGQEIIDKASAQAQIKQNGP